MSCINKASKQYKSLEAIYDDKLAEALVRAYPKNKGRYENDEFYIPTKLQIKDWLTAQKKTILTNVKRALEINPYISQEGIKSLLKGVVSSYKGDLYITTGWLFNGSEALKKEAIHNIYEPNLRIMGELMNSYPDIFDVKDTKNAFVKLVTITPQEVEEDSIEDDVVVPDINESMNAYNTYLKLNKGNKPTKFRVGAHVWKLNLNGLYNLIDESSDIPFLKNVNLVTGMVEEDIDNSPKVQEREIDKALRQLNKLQQEFAIDEILAIKDIDMADVVSDIYNSKTEKELSTVIANLLNKLC